MSVCFFKLLPNDEYSNLLIAKAFTSNPFSYKTSLSDKGSYLPTFLDDKAEIFAFVLSFFWLDFVIDSFDFLTNSPFIISFS